MTLLTDIRGALQTRAALASGFPPEAQRAYEGKTFRPTTDVKWARMTVMNTSRRPFALSDTKIAAGLFQVDLFFPNGQGTAEIETVADAVIGQFEPGDRLEKGSTVVIVNYAEGRMLPEEAEGLHLAVTVSWRCITTS